MPPKNLVKIYAIGGGIVLVAIVAVVMIVIATSTPPAPVEIRGDLVRLQVRSFPARMRVTLDKRDEGLTPKMLLVPRSDHPREITVWFGQEPQTKQVVPNEDHQIVDFKK